MDFLKRIEPKKIGDLLLEKGVITEKQLENALKIQKAEGGLLGSILVKLGLATEEEIAQAITVQYGLPYLPLANYEIDEDIIRLVPAETARKYCIVAVDKMDDALTVACANPVNNPAIGKIEKLTGCRVQVFISTITAINEVIEKYYR